MGYTNASIHSFPFPFHEVLVTLWSAWGKKKKSGVQVHAFQICSAVSVTDLIARLPPQTTTPRCAWSHQHLQVCPSIKYQVLSSPTHGKYQPHVECTCTSTKSIPTVTFTILLEFPCPRSCNSAQFTHSAGLCDGYQYSRTFFPGNNAGQQRILPSRCGGCTHGTSKLNQHPYYTPTFTGVGPVGAVVDHGMENDHACTRAGWNFLVDDM